jgi:hypothetical protein
LEKKHGQHWWIKPLNDALENLCRDNHAHKEASQVYAKVRVINRAYLAGLHRNKTVEWPEMEVAKAFAKAADPIIRPLQSLRKLDRRTIPQVVRGHTDLMNLVEDATKTWQVSFCSKYLSFHLPNTAPIYDSLSVSSAKEVVGSALPSVGEPWCDPTIREHYYGMHCLRVLWLVERLKGAGIVQPRLRVVDFVLYEALNGNRP